MSAPSPDRRGNDRFDVSEAGIGHRFGHFRRSIVRFTAFFLALGVFFYAAKSIDPGQSVATPETDEPAQDAAQDAPRSAGALGELSSLEYTVEIHATIDGPRYTVRNKQGVVLGAMLEAIEVEQIAPGLELESMYGDSLMLAEPKNAYDPD